MQLSKLLAPWIKTDIPNVEILGLNNDSRKVVCGDLFFAYKGACADGRDYIEKAINAGATAILVEPSNFIVKKNFSRKVPIIAIDNIQDKLADIAFRFYNNPTRDIRIIGVTGTNGKTTIAYQLAYAYKLLGINSAYIGTLGAGVVDNLRKLVNTTPDALCLQKLFSDYKKSQIDLVSMEVSSHALSLGRVKNIDFTQAIYTNLSHEHLDFHKNMQSYAEAKANLFRFRSIRTAIINQDDPYASIMLLACHDNCKKVTYGFSAGCDYQAISCSYSLSGSEFTVKSGQSLRKLNIQSIGEFNVYNSLAIYLSLLYSGYSADEAALILSQIPATVGRMEVVATEPYVFVDYSHTPDALKNALNSIIYIRKVNNLPGKIWVVFGCGGDRDTSKRSIMGRIASELADFVILTSDNPRTEDPDKIIADIEYGTLANSNVLKITDRKEAITRALQDANKLDIILIAGKGHEEYQILGDKIIDFSDKKIVKDLIFY